MILGVRNSDQAQWGLFTSASRGIIRGRSTGAGRWRRPHSRARGIDGWGTSLLLRVPLSPCSHSSSSSLSYTQVAGSPKELEVLLWPRSLRVSCLPCSIDQSKSQGQPKFKWKTDSTPWLKERHDCPGNVDGHLFAEKLLQWLTPRSCFKFLHLTSEC